MNQQEIMKRVGELHDTLLKASLNYDIWRVYKMDRKEFITVMNDPKYLLFFKTSIHAHFVACVIALYRLYETRPDTHHIPGLMKSLEGKIDKEKFQEIKDLVKEAKPIWNKISIVRNQVFGHQKLEKTVEEIFKEAKLSIDNFADIISKTRIIIDMIGYEVANTIYAPLNAEDSIKNILNDLKKTK